VKIWLLVNLRFDGGLDIVQRMVVRAASADLARVVACGEAKDEGSAVWLDPAKTSCAELTGAGDAEAVAVVASGF
jgi:hypothetical protein